MPGWRSYSIAILEHIGWTLYEYMSINVRTASHNGCCVRFNSLKMHRIRPALNAKRWRNQSWWTRNQNFRQTQYLLQIWGRNVQSIKEQTSASRQTWAAAHRSPSPRRRDTLPLSNSMHPILSSSKSRWISMVVNTANS